VQKAGENVEVETVYRASQITGMPVMNREREDLGKINDLVLDLQAGEVRYAALSFGGVLGLGDKLFAIPWDALKLRSEADKNFFVLEVDPERLKTAPGFDQENWPNTADPKWHMDIRKHFTSTNATTEKTTVKKTKPIEEGTPDYSAVMRISKVSGMKVKNPDQEELGTIDELVININGGKVRYAALSFGGVLGVGDKLFAIPWDALQFKQNDEESFFVLSVSKERLKTAPGFNKSEWPDTATPEWRQEIDAYYQAKTTKK
jgi:sporulation protein YlmC with PRC-barrel domain